MWRCIDELRVKRGGGKLAAFPETIIPCLVLLSCVCWGSKCETFIDWSGLSGFCIESYASLAASGRKLEERSIGGVGTSITI